MNYNGRSAPPAPHFVESLDEAVGLFVALLFDKIDCLVYGYALRGESFRNRDKHLAVFYIRLKRPIAAVTGFPSNSPTVRGRSKSLRASSRDIEATLCPARRLANRGFSSSVAFPIAPQAETSDFYRHRFPGFGVIAEKAFTHFPLHARRVYFFDFRVKISVEIGNFIFPAQFSVGNVIEFFFHLGSEIIVENFGEILCKEFVDYHAYVSRH